jgi:hypothetical protein
MCPNGFCKAACNIFLMGSGRRSVGMLAYEIQLDPQRFGAFHWINRLRPATKIESLVVRSIDSRLFSDAKWRMHSRVLHHSVTI